MYKRTTDNKCSLTRIVSNILYHFLLVHMKSIKCLAIKNLFITLIIYTHKILNILYLHSSKLNNSYCLSSVIYFVKLSERLPTLRKKYN